jgi:hypothetical protein
MAAMGIWLIGVFIYYMFKKPKKIKVDVYQKNIARN